MRWHDQAVVLLTKAKHDATIVHKGASDLEIQDDIIAFHAQQACEKCLKAILAENGIAYRRTHDLQELSDLLADNGIPLPIKLSDILQWLPYAVLYRYDDAQMALPISRLETSKSIERMIAACASLIP